MSYKTIIQPIHLDVQQVSICISCVLRFQNIPFTNVGLESWLLHLVLSVDHSLQTPRYRLYSSRSNPITHMIAYKTIDEQSISNSKLKYAVQAQATHIPDQGGRPIGLCLNVYSPFKAGQACTSSMKCCQSVFGFIK